MLNSLDAKRNTQKLKQAEKEFVERKKLLRYNEEKGCKSGKE